LLPGEAASRDRRRPQGRGQGGSEKEQRGGAPTDLGHRDRQAQARTRGSLLPVGDTLLPTRLRLCRGRAVPVVGQRLQPDGGDRVRHRQVAACAGRRQHSGRRHAEIPQSVGPHPHRHAEESRGKSGVFDPLKLPQLPQTALDALYGHYAKTLHCGRRPAPPSPPCLSLCATTPPLQNSSTTTSRASDSMKILRYTRSLRTFPQL
jgi:hypothetical protein